VYLPLSAGSAALPMPVVAKARHSAERRIFVLIILLRSFTVLARSLSHSAELKKLSKQLCYNCEGIDATTDRLLHIRINRTKLNQQHLQRRKTRTF